MFLYLGYKRPFGDIHLRNYNVVWQASLPLTPKSCIDVTDKGWNYFLQFQQDKICFKTIVGTCVHFCIGDTISIGRCNTEVVKFQY